ncbi:MAG: hypothetical protein ABSE89_05120 [Sedimentisphaerales bacterium]
MSQALEKYLDHIMVYANRSEADAAKIRMELKDHLLKKIEELEAQGIKRQDAIFQAIETHGNPRNIGYGLRPRFPWIDIRTKGTARGFIAIGPRAVGVIAFGPIACGVVSYGIFAAGLWSFGALTIGLITAVGYLAISPAGWAYGAIALGFMGTMGLTGTGLLSVGVGRSGLGLMPINLIIAAWINLINILTLGIICIIRLIVWLFISRRKQRRIIQADPSPA